MSEARGEFLAASLHDAACKLHGMNLFPLVFIPLFLLCLPLRADGLEVALGVAVGPTNRGVAPQPGDSTTALQLRAGWDSSLSYARIDPWQALAQRGSNENLKYDIAGAGCLRSWWTEYHGALAALGAELRVERHQGGRYSHPFTRLEVAFPLWHQGGEGPGGTLRQMAPRWEGSVQFGMRFGGAIP